MGGFVEGFLDHSTPATDIIIGGPEEGFPLTYLGELCRAVWSAVLITILVAGSICGILAIIRVMAFPGAPSSGFWEMLLQFTWILGMAVLAFSLISSWMWRPIRVRIIDDELEVQTRSATVRVPASTLRWKLAPCVPFDESGAFFPQSRLLVLSTPSRLRPSPRKGISIACGATLEASKEWLTYLMANELPQLPRSSVLHSVLRIDCAAFGVGILAGGLGRWLRPMIPDPNLAGAMTIYGLTLGFAFGVGWNVLRGYGASEAGEFVRNGRPGIIGLGIAAAPIRVSGGRLETRIICSAVCGLAVYFAFGWLRRRVLERESRPGSL